MREGFYSIFYTGNAGSGVLMLCLRNGQIVGVDAAGGSLIGTYTLQGSTVAASCKFHFQAGELVTGQNLAQRVTLDAAFQMPVRMLEGETTLVDIGTGPINARGEFLSDPI